MQLLNLIRSNASFDEIRLAVHNRMDRLSFPPSTSVPASNWTSSSATSSVSPLMSNQMDIQPIQYLESSSGRKIMDINRLTEIPFFELPAKPWTEVTTDNGFVSHLISLWLTWDHVCRNWIDKDLFIAAMKSGDVNSPFCSPFLVNTILSQACVSQPYSERIRKEFCSC